MIEHDDRKNAALDREHRRARVRAQPEYRRKHLNSLVSAVAPEEHPTEHDPELSHHERH
jgi:hypothetical protein